MVSKTKIRKLAEIIESLSPEETRVLNELLEKTEPKRVRRSLRKRRPDRIKRVKTESRRVIKRDADEKETVRRISARRRKIMESLRKRGEEETKNIKRRMIRRPVKRITENKNRDLELKLQKRKFVNKILEKIEKGTIKENSTLLSLRDPITGDTIAHKLAKRHKGEWFTENEKVLGLKNKRGITVKELLG